MRRSRGRRLVDSKLPGRRGTVAKRRACGSLHHTMKGCSKPCTRIVKDPSIHRARRGE